MKSYSHLQQELLHEKAKLAKMTSTVKQLGTKLKEANQERIASNSEAVHYRKLYNELNGKLGQLVLSADECHERANKVNNRGFGF
jgi:uncharacterized coiled-coil DUF342 family protein